MQMGEESGEFLLERGCKLYGLPDQDIHEDLELQVVYPVATDGRNAHRWLGRVAKELAQAECALMEIPSAPAKGFRSTSSGGLTGKNDGGQRWGEQLFGKS